MSRSEISDDDLLAYLDEELSESELVRLEAAVREDDGLRRRLAELISTHDVGATGVGALWRRNRLSCPSRETLGSYLLQVLSPEESLFIRLHLEVTRCVFCESSLADLKRQQARPANASRARQNRYFQGSVGRLPNT